MNVGSKAAEQVGRIENIVVGVNTLSTAISGLESMVEELIGETPTPAAQSPTPPLPVPCLAQVIDELPRKLEDLRCRIAAQVQLLRDRLL